MVYFFLNNKLSQGIQKNYFVRIFMIIGWLIIIPVTTQKKEVYFLKISFFHKQMKIIS